MRRFRFVPDAASIDAADPATTIVVLDVAWTPRPGDRADVLPIRPVFGAVTARRDLFDTALALLDSWADESAIADRLLVDDVTYWFRVRETMWRWLHERLLWRYVLEDLGALDGPVEIVVDADEPALVDVAAASGSHRPSAPPVPEAIALAPPAAESAVPRSSPFGTIRRLLRRVGRLGAPRPAPSPPVQPSPEDAAAAFLDERFDDLVAGGRPRVVVLTTPATYQRVAAADIPRDPILGSVVDALESLGLQVVLVAIGPDHRRQTDMDLIRLDGRMLPLTWFRTRWPSRDDGQRAAAATVGVAEAIADIRSFVIDGLDLTAPFTAALRDHLTRIVSTDVRQRALIDRFLAELRPDAVLLAQEGIRLPWLAASHDRGVPVFAVQHGILYLGHPGYPNRRHHAVRRPTRTFVFGSFERDVLLSRGAYLPEEVVVAGSPRLDLDDDGDTDDTYRGSIRSELGVDPADRLLVVSTVNLPLTQRAHLAPMLECLLGGPLPGVHLCFKLHPGERDDGPYRAIIDGLAAAGRYEPPPVSVRRDIDLLSLLRVADAHLGLHSTVLTDAVWAGTMNLIAMTDAHADLLGYVAAGVAIPVRSREDVLTALSSPIRPAAEARRAFLARHFEPGPSGPRIATSIADVISADPVHRLPGGTPA